MHCQGAVSAEGVVCDMWCPHSTHMPSEKGTTIWLAEG
jgi:hypothetical protein